MTRPGPYRIIACPTCGKPTRLLTMLPIGVFHAILWTDGKTEPVRRPPKVTRCHDCRAFFWTGEAQVFGEMAYWIEAEDDSEEYREYLLEEKSRTTRRPIRQPIYEAEIDEIDRRVERRRRVWQNTPKAWREAPYVRSLRAEELYEAIEVGLAATEDQERTLRIMAWWASNDAAVGTEPNPEWAPPWKWVSVGGLRQRHDLQGLASPLDDTLTTNLEVLSTLLSEDDPEQCLMKAEVARELGQFDETAQLLARDFPEQNRTAAARIRELAQLRERLVSMVSPQNSILFGI